MDEIKIIENALMYMKEPALLIRDGSVVGKNTSAEELFASLNIERDIPLESLLPAKESTRYARCEICGRKFDVTAWDCGAAFAVSFQAEREDEAGAKAVKAITNGLRQPVTYLFNHIKKPDSAYLEKEQNMGREGTYARSIYRLIKLFVNLEALAAVDVTFESLTMVNITELIEKIVSDAAPWASLLGCELKAECDERISIPGFSTRIQQAIYDLVVNGVENAGQNGRVTVRTYRSGETVIVKVSDTGGARSAVRAYRMSGISSVFSGDALVEDSAAIALAAARAVALLHDGTMMVESSSGGTEVTFTLNDISEKDSTVFRSGFGVGAESRLIIPEVMFSNLVPDTEYI